MPGDSVTARVAVHDASLASATLVEEPFLRQGQGSAFVSRPNELVVLALAPAGLTAIHSKVVQLVERGFHSILVSVKGLPKVDADNVKLLLKARRYVENWAGFLKLCDIPREAASLAKTAGFDQDLDVTAPRDAAVEFCRRVMSGESPASASAAIASAIPASTTVSTASSDLLASGDEVTPVVPPPGAAPAAGVDGTATSGDDRASLPAVDVAELVVPAEDLPKLRRQLEGVLSRGKKYVTMRLSFKKRMRSEDVTLLTDARDMLAAAGGQLALASLQQDVATWLRMLDYDREFLIFDDVDAAELAHRRHAAGVEVAPRAPAAKAAAAPEAPFAVVGRAGSSVVVRPRATVGKAQVARVKAPVAVIELTRATLPRLLSEVERVTSAGSQDVVIDAKALEGLRGERLETLSEADALARVKGARLVYARVGRELRAFLKLVGLDGKLPLFEDEDQALLVLARAHHAAKAFEELELVLSRAPIDAAIADARTERVAPMKPAGSSSELKVDLETDDGEQPVSAEEASLRIELSQAKTEAQRLSGEVAASRAKLQELDATRLRLERKVSDLEAAARKNDARLQDLNQGQGSLVGQKVELERKLAELQAARDEALAHAEKAANDAKVARDEAEGARVEVQRLSGELERAQSQQQANAAAGTVDAATQQTIENLEARFREADYARNEAVRISQSANEARKRLDAQVEKLEASLAQARREKTEAESKAEELGAAHKRLEDYVKDVKAERDEASAQAAELERAQEELHGKVSRLESELATLRAGAGAGDESAARLAELEKRAQDAERRAEAAERRVSEGSTQELGKAPASDSELAARVQRLEREKAEILLESKREIERLTREHETLREELESAGEMIERLGKELELT